MNKSKTLLVFTLPLLLSSCVAMFMPQNQNVEISTKNKNSLVFVDNEEQGNGSSVKLRIPKKGSQQVVIQAPNCKDVYYALLPVRRQPGFYPLFMLDVPFLWGLILDPVVPKGAAYKSKYDMPCGSSFINRNENQKYISLTAVKLDIENKKKDLTDYYLYYSPTYSKRYTELEKQKDENEKDAALRAKKKKKGKSLKPIDNQIKIEDPRYSANIYKALKKNGFIDTTGKVLSVNGNFLKLEGSITKISTFQVSGLLGNKMHQTKIFMWWRVWNNYGELLDSLKTEDLSGEFCPITGDKDGTEIFNKMVVDAVDNSFTSLLNKKEFNQYLKVDTNYKITNPVLTLTQPKKFVKDLSDAGPACVIIKRKDGGHGSGFAITNNGYIITNFHVLAGKYFNKLEEVKVLLSSGEEVAAKIVSYNRNRDVALLKVEHMFQTAFKITPTKSFKTFQDVYTIGAPKSIELSQTISSGLLSNERKFGNVNILQLSMSVNPGNSGGPLFDKSGALHGVVSSKLVGYATEGVGFAIPSYLIPGYLNLKLTN